MQLSKYLLNIILTNLVMSCLAILMNLTVQAFFETNLRRDSAFCVVNPCFTNVSLIKNKINILQNVKYSQNINCPNTTFKYKFLSTITSYCKI